MGETASSADRGGEHVGFVDSLSGEGLVNVVHGGDHSGEARSGPRKEKCGMLEDLSRICKSGECWRGDGGRDAMRENQERKEFGWWGEVGGDGDPCGNSEAYGDREACSDS